MSVFNLVNSNSEVVTFYSYYSTVILVLCWMLAPFVFYAIIAKSKRIGKFKYLILNHCVWCLSLETGLGLIKPVIITPR